MTSQFRVTPRSPEMIRPNTLEDRKMTAAMSIPGVFFTEFFMYTTASPTFCLAQCTSPTTMIVNVASPSPQAFPSLPVPGCPFALLLAGGLRYGRPSPFSWGAGGGRPPTTVSEAPSDLEVGFPR